MQQLVCMDVTNSKYCIYSEGGILKNRIKFNIQRKTFLKVRCGAFLQIPSDSNKAHIAIIRLSIRYVKSNKTQLSLLSGA